jgi:imidazolonepropionase-like amidohydrolase
VDTNDHRQLAYEFGSNLIGTVIKRGQVVYGEGIGRRSSTGL